ncbi:LuxR C-terminal-related transcriptional regulator [Lentzea sp. NPDC051213]|uniref:LuxR C-terminal-related transcriptional regulator n=1 Tax=Lentzea sp. NPDC051213 TaxID=3364126 RepID=UPI0037B65D04
MSELIDRVVRSVLSGKPGLTLISGPAGAGRSTVLAHVRDALEKAVSTIHIPVLRKDFGLRERVTAQLALAPSAVLLLDDLDRADRETLCALARLPVTAVGTYRTPVRPDHAALTHVPREVVRLRPLRHADAERVLTDLLQATPVPALLETLYRGSRGNPAVLRLALDGHRAGGSLRIVDRTAHLIPACSPAAPVTHPVLQRLRWHHEPDWTVLKALAVLHPLGAAAEALVAEATGLPSDELRAAFDRLGPHLTRTGQTWRFRAPLLASCLRQGLGPWERQELSRLAVAALRNGTATCPDPAYLPERLMDAAGSIDAEYAGRELLEAGSRVLTLDHHHARRWLWAAAQRLTAPRQRAQALFLHVVVCGLHLDHTAALTSADLVLREHIDDLPITAVTEIQVIRLVGLAASGDRAALHEIAEHGSLPGGPARAIVGQAVALCLTAQWEKAFHLLHNTRATWSSADAATATFGELCGMQAGVLLGRLADFHRIAADPGLLPLFHQPRNRIALQSAINQTLLALGETDCAQPSTVEKALVAVQEDRWDMVLVYGRLALTTRATVGQVLPHTVLCQKLATIHLARAQLARARAVIDQEAPYCLPHVMDLVEADLALLFDGREALSLLNRGLAAAEQQGLVFGTDELWLRLLVLRPDRAQEIAGRLDRIARTVGTGRAHRNHLLAQAIVHRDAGEEVIRLVRHRGRPWEIAETLELLAVHGRGNVRLLREAYDLYGDLDALLPRARLRHLMRERDLSVPGRATTVAENELLLTTLVTEGLTNRELARVLGASEKSVESRLTRLFQRAGHRSRVELATAMLTAR